MTKQRGQELADAFLSRPQLSGWPVHSILKPGMTKGRMVVFPQGLLVGYGLPELPKRPAIRSSRWGGKVEVRMHLRVLETSFGSAIHPPAAVPRSRLLLLFLLFFFICCGLGYPILNRIDWRQAPGGLDDVLKYAALVTTAPTPDLNQHMQFRVLVPYLARPIYRIAKNHIGTWDPIMFALLVVNSTFVALTVTVLLIVVHRATRKLRGGPRLGVDLPAQFCRS